MARRDRTAPSVSGKYRGMVQRQVVMDDLLA